MTDVDERWLLRHGHLDLVLWADSMVGCKTRGKGHLGRVSFVSNQMSGPIARDDVDAWGRDCARAFVEGR